MVIAGHLASYMHRIGSRVLARRRRGNHERGKAYIGVLLPVFVWQFIYEFCLDVL